MADTPWQFLQMALRYLVGADIDKSGFKTRLEGLRDPQTRAAAMSLAQQLRQEGLLKGRQEDILEALELRFERVPVGLAEAVRLVVDEVKLRQLLRSAIRCESVEAFAAEL